MITANANAILEITMSFLDIRPSLPAAKTVATPEAHPMVAMLRAAAAAFDARMAREASNTFLHGKAATCLDIAAKLERFGSFKSDAQAQFADKLIAWSSPRVPPVVPADTRPVPAAPERKLSTPLLPLPRLFALMQRLSKLTIGDVTIARKNQDSLCWIKVEGVEGVVGRLEGGQAVLRQRLGVDLGGLQSDLLRIEADPEAAAVAHGKASGRCSVCSRDLTDPASIERGIGPVCAEKFSFGV